MKINRINLIKSPFQSTPLLSGENEAMFRESLKEEAEELSASAFGGTLLYTIGLCYRCISCVIVSICLFVHLFVCVLVW